MAGGSHSEQWFKALGSASDMEQVNPMTGSMWDLISGNIRNLNGGNTSQGIGVSDILGRLSGGSGQTMNLAQTMMGDYGNAAEVNRDAIIAESMRQTSGQFADQGALNSGAALSAMSRGAAAPAAQYAQNMAQMQSGLAQNIMGQALGAETTSLQNLYGLGGQFGMPTFWQPTWVADSATEGSWGI